MSDQSWPAGLPQEILTDFQLSSDPAFVDFVVDAGPAKRRRVTTKERNYVRASLELTGAELATFNTFWESTLQHGTLDFDWEHPTSDTSATLRFKTKPSIVLVVPAALPADRVYSLEMELEIL